MPSDAEPDSVRTESDIGGLDPHTTQGAPRRLHPISPFLNLIASARQLAFPLFIALSTGRGSGFTAIGFAVLFPLMRTLAWFRHTYVIEAGVLRVESGIVRRRVRELRLERIQQVNLDRKLRHRLFGVVQVQVQTAGGSSGAEVDLDCVSEAEAQRLQAVLLAARSSSVRIEPDVPEPWSSPSHARPILTLSTTDAALAGMTQSRLPVLLTMVAFGSQVVSELLDAEVAIGASAEVPGLPRIALPIAVALGISALTLAWFALGAVAGVLQHHGFELVERDGELHARRGLLTQREARVPISRVQLVRIEAGPIRRILGLSSMVLQSAGNTGESNLLLVPLARRTDIDRVLTIAIPGVTRLAEVRRHPRAAWRRGLIRRLVLLSPLWAASLAGTVLHSPAWLVATVALVAIAVGWAEAAYRGLGHAYVGDVVTMRRGATTRRTWIVPAAKAQSLRLTTSPFQRRAGLADLAIDIAGAGSPTITDADDRDLPPIVKAILAARPRPA